MIQRIFLKLIVVASVSAGTVGTNVNGTWLSIGCGTEPKVPVFERRSIDAYNKSVNAINGVEMLG